MPTNYLLPLLAQPGQMQLIYTVSPGVSHTTGTLHAGPRELYSPELGLFGGGDEEAQVVPQLFITQDFFPLGESRVLQNFVCQTAVSKC